MGRPSNGASLLSRTQRRLDQWREKNGGPGRRIPEELWNAAAEVAREEGVGATARRLRLRAERLARLVAALDAPRDERNVEYEFVELGGEEVCLQGRTVLQFIGRDGEQLRIDVTGTSGVDVASVARAFWSRSS